MILAVNKENRLHAEVAPSWLGNSFSLQGLSENTRIPSMMDIVSFFWSRRTTGLSSFSMTPFFEAKENCMPKIGIFKIERLGKAHFFANAEICRHKYLAISLTNQTFLLADSFSRKCPDRKMPPKHIQIGRSVENSSLCK